MADTGKLKRENTALLRQAMQNGSAGKNDLARLSTSSAFRPSAALWMRWSSAEKRKKSARRLPLVDAAPCSTG